MRKDFETLFGKLKAPEPPAGLRWKIIQRIALEENIAASRRKTAFFFALLTSFIAALFPFLQMAKHESVESGFFDYISLLFSNFGGTMESWRSFGLGLLESLPATSLSAFLLVLFAGLFSLKFLTNRSYGHQ